MGAKGTSKRGCCDGCSTPPAAISQGITPQLAGVFCCSCIPTQLCAEYHCGYTKSSGLLDLIQCNTVQDNYSGVVPINGQQVTVSLYLQIDPVYGHCSICLRGYASFGIADQCIVITDAIRAALCATCQTCAELGSAAILSFDLGGGCALNIRRAANTSLKPAPLAYGCPDPCTDPYASGSPYANNCNGPCAGCDCICTQAQITVVNGDSAGTELATLCNNVWSLSSGVKIALTGAPGCCHLVVLSTGSMVSDSPLLPVAIDAFANPCPNPTGVWRFNDVSDSYHHKLSAIYFNCASCDGTAIGVGDSGCCPNPLPRVLHAHVTVNLAGCGCHGGSELVDVFVTLVFNAGFWTGQWDCPNPPNPPLTYPVVGRVSLVLGCTSGGTNSGNWALSGDLFPLTGNGFVQQGQGSCDPPMAVFKTSSNVIAGGPGSACNQGGDPLNPVSIPYTITVTIME